jgi:hypothetical protein
MPHLLELLTPLALDKIQHIGLTLDSFTNVKETFNKIFKRVNKYNNEAPKGNQFAVPQIFMDDYDYIVLCLNNCIDMKKYKLDETRNHLNKFLTQSEIDNSVSDTLFLKKIKEKNDNSIYTCNIHHDSEFHVSEFKIDYSEFVLDSDDNIWIACHMPGDSNSYWFNIFDLRWTYGDIVNTNKYICYTKKVSIFTTEIPSINTVINMSDVYKKENFTKYLKNCNIFLDEFLQSELNLDKNSILRIIFRNKIYAGFNNMCFLDPVRIPFGLLLSLNCYYINNIIVCHFEAKLCQIVTTLICHMTDKSRFETFLIGTLRRKNDSNRSIVNILPNDILYVIMNNVINNKTLGN